jgi:uncharacterized protein (TIGR03435 family)
MMKGGPGSSDPERIRYSAVSLADLITTAYDLEKYQIVGPKWIQEPKFDVSATLAPGSTKAQMHQMLQALLQERFGLEAHPETQELAVYSLVVDKNGPKLHIHKKEETPAAGDDIEIHDFVLGKDRLPVMPPNFPGHFMGMILPGKTMYRARDASAGEIAHLLTGCVDRPVFDETHLTETYDFGFAFSTEFQNPYDAKAVALRNSTAMYDPEVDAFGAVKSQLGLRLEPGKRQVQMLVLDSVHRTPSEY